MLFVDDQVKLTSAQKTKKEVTKIEESDVSPGSKVSNIGELLERVLEHVDDKTFMRTKFAATQFYDEVERQLFESAFSMRSKELWFTKPIFHDLISLGVINSDTIVHSNNSQKIAVLNPWLFDYKNPNGVTGSITVVLKPSILAELKSSTACDMIWKKMYVRTDEGDDEDEIFCCSLHISKGVIKDRQDPRYGLLVDVEPSIEGYPLPRVGQTMKDFLTEAQWFADHKIGVEIDWDTAYIDVHWYSMCCSKHQELCEDAAAEEKADPGLIIESWDLLDDFSEHDLSINIDVAKEDD